MTSGLLHQRMSVLFRTKRSVGPIKKFFKYCFQGVALGTVSVTNSELDYSGHTLKAATGFSKFC